MESIDQRLDRLTMIVDTLAATAVAHDNQLETQAKHFSVQLETQAKHLSVQLETQAKNISAQGENIDKLIVLAKEQRAAMADLEKRWQAYLNTIHPRQ